MSETERIRCDCGARGEKSHPWEPGEYCPQLPTETETETEQDQNPTSVPDDAGQEDSEAPVEPSEPVILQRRVCWEVKGDKGGTISISIDGLRGDHAGQPRDVNEIWRRLAEMYLMVIEQPGTTYEWAPPHVEWEED